MSIIERSKDVSLKQARHVIHRLRRRQLYRFADEQLLPTDRSPDIQPVDVTTCQDAARAGVTLTPDDVHVKTVTLNFGMKEQNPVDNVLFFKNWYVYVVPSFVVIIKRPGLFDTIRIKISMLTVISF